MAKSVKIILNSKDKELKEGTTVSELLLEIGNERGAVWINGTQLLRKEYDSRIIFNGDKVKVLRIIAGG